MSTKESHKQQNGVEIREGGRKEEGGVACATVQGEQVVGRTELSRASVDLLDPVSAIRALSAATITESVCERLVHLCRDKAKEENTSKAVSTFPAAIL